MHFWYRDFFCTLKHTRIIKKKMNRAKKIRSAKKKTQTQKKAPTLNSRGDMRWAWKREGKKKEEGGYHGATRLTLTRKLRVRTEVSTSRALPTEWRFSLSHFAPVLFTAYLLPFLHVTLNLVFLLNCPWPAEPPGAPPTRSRRPGEWRGRSCE